MIQLSHLPLFPTLRQGLSYAQSSASAVAFVVLVAFQC